MAEALLWAWKNKGLVGLALAALIIAGLSATLFVERGVISSQKTTIAAKDIAIDEQKAVTKRVTGERDVAIKQANDNAEALVKYKAERDAADMAAATDAKNVIDREQVDATVRKEVARVRETHKEPPPVVGPYTLTTLGVLRDKQRSRAAADADANQGRAVRDPGSAAPVHGGSGNP